MSDKKKKRKYTNSVEKVKKFSCFCDIDQTTGVHKMMQKAA